MSVGLIALLDDVAALAKLAAASLDDVAAQAGKAGAKAMGVVVDDAAVTPRYVTGFAASRELPIVWRIALGSLKNKLLFLLPGALALSLLAPWLITPLLMLGGLYLCYEGAEKVLHALQPGGDHHQAPVTVASPEEARALEETRVRGAIQTDFILSAEIMALTLASMPELSFTMQAAVLAVVGIGITMLVYGVVALIVKADDAGVALVARGGRLSGAIGRGLVAGMPHVLRVLAVLGTAAMLWVGGGILLHGLEELGLPEPGHWAHDAAHAVGGLVPAIGAALEWIAYAALSGVLGLVVGFAVIPVAGLLGRVMARFTGAARQGAAH